MQCYFCQHNIKRIDFKNTILLTRFMSEMHKIRPKRKTGVCSSHQRKLSRAIKKARYMALVPYTKT